MWTVERRARAKAGMTKPVARRLVSVVRGVCTSMRASLLAAMLRASFVSEIVARSSFSLCCLVFLYRYHFTNVIVLLPVRFVCKLS